MIYRLYEKILLRDLQKLPEQICFMITGQDMLDAPENIFRATEWSRELGIRSVMFHISTDAPASLERCLPRIRAISSIARLTLYYLDKKEVSGEGMDVTVAIGKSGREEIADCIRRMAKDGIDPEAVDEDLLESYLTYKYEPDLVIKTGGDHLTDFLIWQSVYSELFFLDVNWALLRKVDFLRALRDFQSRARRFGR
ncbi:MULTISPECIES: undecaprenyl diphosphate synthase family protein [Methanoculleus]|uniref:Undecaprenyl diphosphate synthase n=1 Tax=Methanoculleus thermophilus TaxID=2200 RepID=A0A1G9C4L2_9EURY|nr:MULTISPECIES: undecaprenyl diphosphate synthase family protein [Methanoculleus]NLN09869.1 undecaprenyl diphosphate synthase family protein [Methanoculleus thermophilus]SDK46334.1 undecaprenyl diphosphate synthase [Methanoculleus thermophilus]HQD26717.1 undecaprenyl diphosphate synthase family protein [Methanoculleus thermophilus]